MTCLFQLLGYCDKHRSGAFIGEDLGEQAVALVPLITCGRDAVLQQRDQTLELRDHAAGRRAAVDQMCGVDAVSRESFVDSSSGFR